MRCPATARHQPQRGHPCAGPAQSASTRPRTIPPTAVTSAQAMGQGAVRSQTDVRISFRVRERKDVDLILGQGMLAAGWHARTLNAPGKFLVAAAEHDVPKRARANLATDQAVASTNAIYADSRPSLDPISQRALIQDLRSGDAYPERNRPTWHLPAPVAGDDEDPGDAPGPFASDESRRRTCRPRMPGRSAGSTWPGQPASCCSRRRSCSAVTSSARSAPAASAR